MAEARGRGDNRAARSTQGQQSGSKRPRATTGSASDAPKKGDVPPKGTRAGSAPKGTPSKESRVAKPKR
jgi:hypothetical protein